MEELITVQKYASRNRLSLHAVIKKTMSGELQTVVKNENGKEVTYIVTSMAEPSPTVSSITAVAADEECPIDYRKEYEALHREYLVLKTRYDRLLEEHKSR